MGPEQPGRPTNYATRQAQGHAVPPPLLLSRCTSLRAARRAAAAPPLGRCALRAVEAGRDGS